MSSTMSVPPSGIPIIPLAEGPGARPRGPWKFWGTTAWAGGAVILSTVGSWMIYQELTPIDPFIDPTADEWDELLHSQSVLLFVASSVMALIAFGVLALAVRLSGLGIRDYLGLKMPRWRELLIGIVGLVVILVPESIVGGLIAGDDVAISLREYRAAQAAGGVPFLALEAVIVGPLIEELVVRGFIFRGWAASRLGPTPTIVLTAALWAEAHIQYSSQVAIAFIFCTGLLFGWLRNRSGSTVLTMVLHGIANALAVITAALSVWLDIDPLTEGAAYSLINV